MSDKRSSSSRKVPGRFLRTLKTGSLTSAVGSSYLGGKLFDRFRSADKRAEVSAQRHARNAKRIVETMGELRGPLMKIGQLLSTHAEALPGEYVDILGALQSKAPAMPYDQVRDQLHAELGQWPEDAFVRFDPQALAAASIGQVHRAVIDHDGQHIDVAVKIQYPGAEDMVRSDLSNMASAVKAVKSVASDVLGQTRLDFTPVYEEIGEHIRQETDYCREAYNAQLMRAALSGIDDIIVPPVYNSHSSLRVITYGFIDGQNLADFLASDPPEDERHRINTLLATGFWNQIFGQGIMHADPHPGNYLVTNDGRLALLDFGCVKIFSDTWLRNFNALMRAHILGDRADEIQAIIDLDLVDDPSDEAAVNDILMIGDYFASGLIEDKPVNFHHYGYAAKAQALVKHFMSNKRVPKSQRDMIFLTRVSLGLYEYFSQLNVGVNYHRIALPFIQTPWAGRRVPIPDYYME